MYDKNTIIPTTLSCDNAYKGNSIEEKVRRISENNEPIDDSSPLMYTNRKDGVNADYNIRTDRWDIAVEAMDKVAKAKIAQKAIVTGKQIGRAHV